MKSSLSFYSLSVFVFVVQSNNFIKKEFHIVKSNATRQKYLLFKIPKQLNLTKQNLVNNQTVFSALSLQFYSLGQVAGCKTY